MISIVNPIFVYQIPVQKEENFIWGLMGMKKNFLGPKSKNMLYAMIHPHLHTKPTLLKCRSVQRSQIFKQN